MALSGNAYARDPNQRSSEEKVVLYETNEPIGDRQVRPSLDDARSRNRIMTRENVSVSEAIESGEM